MYRNMVANRALCLDEPAAVYFATIAWDEW